MTEKLNLRMFSISSFDIENITAKPLLFDYGDNIKLDIRLHLAPSPSDFLYLVQKEAKAMPNGRLSPEQKNSINIISRINNVQVKEDITLRKTLQSFLTPIEGLKEFGDHGFYEINNQFNFSSSKIESNAINHINRFELEVIWKTISDLFSGEIMKIELPIIEMIR